MDKLIYTAMTGAKYAMSRQDMHAQNLANATTTGYRAETAAYRAVPLQGSPTRVFVLDATTGADLSPGAVKQTGRSLDIALHGAGWIAVEDREGREAYTRNGSLQVSAAGILTTDAGLPVLSDGGPLSVPQDAAIRIASDGTVSAIPATSAVTSSGNSSGRLYLWMIDRMSTPGASGAPSTRSTRPRGMLSRLSHRSIDATTFSPSSGGGSGSSERLSSMLGGRVALSGWT